MLNWAGTTSPVTPVSSVPPLARSQHSQCFIPAMSSYLFKTICGAGLLASS